MTYATTQDAVNDAAEILADATRTRTRLEHLTEAADEVEYCFNRYKNAESTLDQANAFLMLSDAVIEMATYIPGFNNLTREIERP